MTWEQNSSFHKSLPLQLAWDSTSLGSFKTCPRLYYYQIIRGYTPRSLNIHLVFGTIYHGAMERFHHAVAAGKGHDEAQLLAVDHCMKESWDKELGRPLGVLCEDNYKNRLNLVRSVVWYLEQFKDDALKTILLANGKPAVELSFRFETEFRSRDNTPFTYCGHIDRLAELNGETFVADYKTTKTIISQHFFSSFSPNNQFTGYIAGGKVLAVNAPRKLIVDAAQIAVGFSRFERGIVERSDFQIEEWFRGMGYVLKLAEIYAEADFWPLNELACGNYGGCPFRSVCSKKGPKVREEWLGEAFARRTWDPLQIRGDV